MPVVSRADCSTLSRGGLTACQDNDLSKHYKNRMGAPGGDLDFNLVGTCDNANAPVSIDYAYTMERSTSDSSDEDAAVAAVLNTCAYNTYMCCWTQNDGGMVDNTDVCRVVDSPSVGQTLEYPGESEGSTYCHGFGWEKGDTFLNVQLRKSLLLSMCWSLKFLFATKVLQPRDRLDCKE